jgi:superfamily II DNA helicase RecQ
MSEYTSTDDCNISELATLDRMERDAQDCAELEYNDEVLEEITAMERNAPKRTLQETLHEYFGLTDFRDGQEEVIDAALSGRDTLVFWATGKGKSLCFQLPALHSGKTTIIISPLISLMQDQCLKFNKMTNSNVAVFLGSAQEDKKTEALHLLGSTCWSTAAQRKRFKLHLLTL